MHQRGNPTDSMWLLEGLLAMGRTTLAVVIGSLLVVGWVDWPGHLGDVLADGMNPGAGRATSHGLPHKEARLGDVPPGVQALLTDIVRENMPHHYEDTRHWGKTKEVFDGIKLRREGLRLETKRRKKRVKHGTWHRYRLSLIEPEENLKVRIRHIHETQDGKVALQAVVAAPVHAFGRMSEWRRDVQLISLSVEAVAQIELRMDCELAILIDPSVLPPDVSIRPKVTDANLIAHSFRVQRISKAKGPLARELGRRLHDVVMRKVEEKKQRMVAKINRQIVKHQDELRFSLRDMLVEKWLPPASRQPAGTAKAADPNRAGENVPSWSRPALLTEPKAAPVP